MIQEHEGSMILRPMLESDLPFMLEVRNEVRHLIHDDRVFSLDDCIEWFHTQHPENYIVVMSGNDVGVMRVRRYKQHNHSAEIGGDIHKQYRKQGLGSRAYKILIPYLFDIPCMDELFLEVLASNMVAFNLYRKLGFEIHTYEPNMAKRVDRNVDGFVMNLTRDKWNEEV